MTHYQVREPAPDEMHAELSMYPRLLRELLFGRGIDDLAAATVFCQPDYERDTYDPLLLKDMDRAVSRLVQALEGNERVAIYSDYDTDGIPGGTLLHDVFKKIGYDNFTNYIPHRNRDGFGLNTTALDMLAAEGVGLVITIDCGIGGGAEVAHANSIGVDVIITDHHLPGQLIPEAYAIINPKQAGDTYPFKDLCGSAVVFKLAQALLAALPGSNYKLPDPVPDGWDKWLLDMVGIATLSDMVPLVGENRVFAYFGLKVLRKTTRPGLKALLKIAKVKQAYLTEDDVGFMIGPRINAASRMDAPEKALHLLAATDTDVAHECAVELQHLNDERKGHVAAMVKAGRGKITASGRDRSVVVIGDPRWQPGLLGLVANKIVEVYDKPVFVWGRGDAQDIKGSCRTNGSVNLVELMQAAQDATTVFIEHGGHSASGGFAISHDKIHELDDALNEAYPSVTNGSTTDATVVVDARLTLDDVNWETMHMINHLAPFGVGNPKPQFMFEKLRVRGVKHFGKEQNHLEVTFHNSDGKDVTAIGFFMTDQDFDRKIVAGEIVTLVATLEESFFRGRPELRLRIVDIV